MIVDAWARETERRVEGATLQHDPDFIQRLVPLMERFSRYFDSEVRGFEHVPEHGPMLLVGNHSGGALTPDTSAFLARWYRERGCDEPLVGLAFDAAFSIPGFRTILRRLGLVPASPKNAGRVLEEGRSLFVYPGGAHEVFRPWGDRNRIDFAGHMGFVRLALRHGVPVVPVVGHGGQETIIVLTRGERLGKAMGLDRVRLRAVPFLLKPPWGLAPAGIPGIPLPAKITVQITPGPPTARKRPTIPRSCSAATTRSRPPCRPRWIGWPRRTRDRC